MSAHLSLRVAAFVAPAILLLASCSGEREPTQAERAAAATVPGAPPTAIEDVIAESAAASNVGEENDLIQFSYRYPREAAKIPKLAEWLDSDRATKRDALIAKSHRDEARAHQVGFPYRRHSYQQAWQRITSTPRFLSLSSVIETYVGGAHGTTDFETMLWDRNRAMQRHPLDLFTSGEAFDAAIRDDFCAAIWRAKRAKGIAWPEEQEARVKACPPASAQTVWLGSSDGRYLDRLTIAIAPYEIGPYAEGDYRINVPVTQALVRAVRPDFARDFLPVK